MSLTRRSVLIAGLSSALMANRIGANDAATPLRIRHNVASEAGQRMLEKYARAVSRMMQPGEIPERDARSWTYQWYIHAVPPERNDSPAGKPRELNRVFGSGAHPAKALANELWTTCQAHMPQSDRHMFLPWHRMYLLAFEEIVRSVLADADFTLPYWDYTTQGNRALPAQFRAKDDAKFGALYRENRRKLPQLDINAGDPMDKGTTVSPFNLSSLEIAQYSGADGFCSTLDRFLHGSVHVGVGDDSNMGFVPTAAGDPIFWLHHCNIDRIWAAWNDRGGKNPAMSRKFPFADPKGVRIEMDAQNMGDTRTLGYAYDTLPPKPEATQVTMSTASSSESVLASSNAAPKALGAAPTRIALTPTAPATEIGTAVTGTGEDQRLVVEIAGIRCATQPGTLYEVFLDLPSNPSAETKREHYVGTFNFFDAVDAEAVARFDATATLRRLRAANRLASQTSVTIVPVHAPTVNAGTVVGRIQVVQQ